jgi:hypothetical protein
VDWAPCSISRRAAFLDDLVRRPERGGETTIGILLAADRADDQ